MFLVEFRTAKTIAAVWRRPSPKKATSFAQHDEAPTNPPFELT
jgi:hypothetical protein